MNPSRLPGIDLDQYRKHVLLLPDEESEVSRERNLFDEARQLGLETSELESAASLATPITSSSVGGGGNGNGEVLLSSPVVSSVYSSSSTNPDRHSFCDTDTATVSSRDTFALDNLSSSLSEITTPSNRAMSGGSTSTGFGLGSGTRPIASSSTRPISLCSAGSGGGNGGDGNDGKLRPNHRNSSALNVVIPEMTKSKTKERSPVTTTPEKKERRRRSLVSAFGRIYSHTRKARSPSSTSSSPSRSSPPAVPTVRLPSQARSTNGSREGGETRAELKREHVNNQGQGQRHGQCAGSQREILKLEIPVFDDEALRRSLKDPELVEMLESHKSERDRHLAFQNASVDQLRSRQQAALNEMLSRHRALEEEKRERNALHASRMEERQLAMEMDQRREFERAKTNSRTRIKHMERYFDNLGPPSKSESSGNDANDSSDNNDNNTNDSNNTLNNNNNSNTQQQQQQPTRQFTPQQKAQLAQEYHDYRSMDQLHDSKIKVFCDRQELKLQESIARTEKELDNMIGLHARAFADLRREHRQDEASLLHAIDGKKTTLRRRWCLEESILRRKLESRRGVSYGPLPTVSFTSSGGGGDNEHDEHDGSRDSAICVTTDTNIITTNHNNSAMDADADADADTNAGKGIKPTAVTGVDDEHGHGHGEDGNDDEKKSTGSAAFRHSKR